LAFPQAPLDALLADAGFAPLRRALWLDALDLRLRPCLPPALAAHARLANLDGDRLVFVVDGPVWRAKLRLAAPEVLDAARSLGLGVTQLVVKTSSEPAPQTAGSPRARPMSEAARSALQAALDSLREPSASDGDGTES
jgi:hypothetical protein